jgi:diguanylate cyclase (GGDEF)-like protein
MVCPPDFDQLNDIQAGISGAVLESYLAVIAEIACCIGATCPEVASPHQEHLLRMRSRLAFGSDEHTLAETRAAIENELRAYTERARAHRERRSDDLRRILEAFSLATEVLAERNEAASLQLSGFSKQINEIADAVPWLNVRDALRDIVAGAPSQMDLLRFDSQLAHAHVEEQIRVFQSRLVARNPQHLDVLTGLGDRNAVAEQIARRIKSRKPFALLLFQATNLAAIAASTGPAAADQVLAQAAARLAGQVRAHDYVGRWSANEFAVVMECPPEDAAPRSLQIAQWLCGAYVLRGNAAAKLVEAAFTVRVVDSALEESETSPLPA